MKDAERLDLLKEIGGTRVYEERRKESLKIMQDTGKSLTFYNEIVMKKRMDIFVTTSSLIRRKSEKADHRSSSIYRRKIARIG
jgi:structural maintenance of chromosome 3 (chondroitin sulfate proteoglycan 6)